jgi:hypothetical protein
MMMTRAGIEPFDEGSRIDIYIKRRYAASLRRRRMRNSRDMFEIDHPQEGKAITATTLWADVQPA